MVDIVANPEWKSVRILERDEVALGGYGGNMNEQATALVARTELLMQEKANTSDIIQGQYSFSTLAEFDSKKATIPANSVVIIDEAGVNQGSNTWDGTSLTKSAYDPLKLANEYTDNITTKYNYTSFTQGVYVRADGTQATNASYACTDFIAVSTGLSYEIKTKLTSGAPLVWYDKNKRFLSIDYANQTTLSTHTYTAPQNAAFVRVNLNGTVTTDKPFLRIKPTSVDDLNKWFEQWQLPTIQDMIPTHNESEDVAIDKKAIDALILQGVAPYWVKRAADGSAATLDFDLENNRFFYRGTEYTTLNEAIIAVGGASKIVYSDTKAFVLNGNYNEDSINLAKAANTETLDIAKITTVDTTVTKANNALALSRNSGTTGVSATLTFKVKADTTYVIKSANKTGLQGVRLSIQNSTGGSVLAIGAWQTATEELREFITTEAGTYTLKIEMAGNGTTSYLSYVELHESVAFVGLNKDGFTIVADYTPLTATANECYMLVGQTATGRASYNNHYAVVRIPSDTTFPTTSNMRFRDGTRAAYIANQSTGNNIAQVGSKSTMALSIGGGFVSMSSGYHTKKIDVNHSLVNMMNPAMIAIGCGGTNGNEKATATIHRVSIFSKAYKDIAQSTEFYVDQSDKYLVLGDSFATKAFADALQTKLGKVVLADGVGGSTLYQQAKRFESEPALWKCKLIMMDGGFEWVAKYGLDFVNPIQRILTCLESVGNNKYYYVEPSPAGFAELANGTAGRNDWNAGIERIKKIVGNDRYIPTLAQMQTFGDGSATDNALIAQNLMPVSLTLDGQHENAKGTGHRTDIVKDWIDSHPL